jgi:hypothetical protein
MMVSKQGNIIPFYQRTILPTGRCTGVVDLYEKKEHLASIRSHTHTYEGRDKKVIRRKRKRISRIMEERPEKKKKPDRGSVRGPH